MKRPLILNVDDREISRYLRSQSLIEGGFTPHRCLYRL